jgi:hypothetical protein
VVARDRIVDGSSDRSRAAVLFASTGGKGAADSSTRTLFCWGEAGISPGSVVVDRRVTGELFIDSSPDRYVGSGLPEY